MKLRDVFKKVDDANAAKEKILGEIAALEHELDDLNARAESTAAAGDEEEYIRLTDEASRISRRIYVKKKISDTPAGSELTESEVVKSWNEYAAECEKHFNKNYDKIVKIRQELHDVYEEMIEDQYKILQTRVRLYNLVQPPADTYVTIDMRFPFKRIPTPERKTSFQTLRPKISCYGTDFTEFVTPMLYADEVIDQKTAERWAAIINGLTDVPPSKTYRAKGDGHVDPLGLFRN